MNTQANTALFQAKFKFLMNSCLLCRTQAEKKEICFKGYNLCCSCVTFTRLKKTEKCMEHREQNHSEISLDSNFSRCDTVKHHSRHHQLKIKCSATVQHFTTVLQINYCSIFMEHSQ